MVESIHLFSKKSDFFFYFFCYQPGYEKNFIQTVSDIDNHVVVGSNI